MSFGYIYKAVKLIERNPAPFARALGPRGGLTEHNYTTRMLDALDVVFGPGTAGRLALGIRRLPARQQARMIRRFRLALCTVLTSMITS